MLARKCDFCGKLYEHYEGCNHNEERANAIVFIDRALYEFYTEYRICDLCPECVNRLLKMMENDIIEEPLPTIAEMRVYIKDYCQKHHCYNCVICDLPQHRRGYCYYEGCTDDEIITNYKAIKESEVNNNDKD